MYQSHKFETSVPMLTVSDIKQFVYCPRIVYFRYVLPISVSTTYAMRAGGEAHDRIERLDRRRTTRKYQLAEGNRLFRYNLNSERLCLTGVLDLLIESGKNLFPVEYKHSVGMPSLHHRYQLTAYAMLVEDAYHQSIRRGYVYVLRPDEVFPVEITESKKLRVKSIVKTIGRMIETQIMPAPTPHRGRCQSCEFRFFCADTV